MSKKLSKRRAYNANDWKNADRLGKLRIHVADPDDFKLSPTDEEYLYRIRRCWVIFSQHYTNASQLAALHNEFSTLSDRSLRKLIQDAKAFYGDFQQETRQFNLIQQNERLYRLLEYAMEDGDHALALDIEKQIAKNRLEIPELVHDDIDLPPSTITFDSDPALLQSGGYSDIEDAILEDE